MKFVFYIIFCIYIFAPTRQIKKGGVAQDFKCLICIFYSQHYFLFPKFVQNCISQNSIRLKIKKSNWRPVRVCVRLIGDISDWLLAVCLIFDLICGGALYCSFNPEKSWDFLWQLFCKGLCWWTNQFVQGSHSKVC